MHMLKLEYLTNFLINNILTLSYFRLKRVIVEYNTSLEDGNFRHLFGWCAEVATVNGTSYILKLLQGVFNNIY